MTRWVKYGLLGVALLPLLAGVAGQSSGSGILHPQRKPLAVEQVEAAQTRLAPLGAALEDFEARATDGALLRGWKVRAPEPIPSAGSGTGGEWVLLYHGVSDNRTGTLNHAEFLLRAGYSVVLMDSRAHGASDGAMATYGWLERHDTRAVVDALLESQQPHCLFVLGVSMGAAIALQSAGEDARIHGAVAEAPFASLREAAFDYAGLRVHHWLGRTLLRPAVWSSLGAAEREGGFRAEDVSPEKAVAARIFPVLLICATRDRNIPCRHARRILKSATGPKELWEVRGARHAAALGHAAAEYQRRVLAFFEGIHGRQQGRTCVSERGRAQRGAQVRPC